MSSTRGTEADVEVAFEHFYLDVEPRLRHALSAALGPERGREAAAEALAWAFENQSRLEAVEYPVAYLYRVGRSRTRPRRFRLALEHSAEEEHSFEPQLGRSMARLTERQRVSVVLVHGFGWSLVEVGELLGIRPTSVQNHVERALRHLRHDLGGNGT